MYSSLSSTRIDNLPPYNLSEVGSRVHKLRMDGCDVIDCSQLNPTLPPPQIALDRLVEASLLPQNHRYSSSAGIGLLRDAFARYYSKSFGVELDSLKEIVVTQGTKEACIHVLLSVLSPGDTALIPVPAYPVHSAAVTIAGASFVGVPLWPDYETYKEANGVLDSNSDYFFSRLENRYMQTWPRPKVLITSFPHNPTASIVTRCFYERLVEFSLKHKVLLLNDFAHGDLYYDIKDTCSLLSIESAKGNAIEFYSASKGFSLPGWRIGCAVGNESVISKVKALNSFSGFGIFQPIQIAMSKVLNQVVAESVNHITSENCQIYHDRHTLVKEGLEKLGFEIANSKATSMIWARIPSRYRSDGADQFCRKLLEDCHVAFSPGTGFDSEQQELVRISLLESDRRYRELFRRLELWRG